MTIKTTLEKVNEGIKAIQRNGGRVIIRGDDGTVYISGVEARFTFHQETGDLTVVIDDKPWLASDSMIEEKINEFFA